MNLPSCHVMWHQYGNYSQKEYTMTMIALTQIITIRIHGKRKDYNEIIDIEKHSEKESYAGVCDDPNLGVTLIFYLQNVCDYLSEKAYINIEVRAKGAVLSGLSVMAVFCYQ